MEHGAKENHIIRLVDEFKNKLIIQLFTKRENLDFHYIESNNLHYLPQMIIWYVQGLSVNLNPFFCKVPVVQCLILACHNMKWKWNVTRKTKVWDMKN